MFICGQGAQRMCKNDRTLSFLSAYKINDVHVIGILNDCIFRISRQNRHLKREEKERKENDLCKKNVQKLKHYITF